MSCYIEMRFEVLGDTIVLPPNKTRFENDIKM